MSLELRLFGGLSLLVGGQPVSGAAAQPRRTAVLAILAHAWPGVVTRERLVGLVWPDQEEASGRRLLTQALYSLRRELGDVIHTSGRDVGLHADRMVADVVEFRRALAAGSAARAMELCRGPFLDGFYVRSGAEFERWMEAARGELQREASSAIESLVAQHAAAGDAREARRWAERALADAPFDAAAVLRFMTLAERSGDPASALRAAAAYEQRMREELELEPDGDVARRVTQLRAAGTKASTVESTTTPETRRPEAPTAPVVDPATAAASPRARPAPRGAWRGARLPVIAAAAALALTVAIVAIVARRGAPAASAQPPVVTVTPFEVRGDGAADVSATLGTILVANLDGTAGAHVVAADSSAHVKSRGELRGVVVAAGRQLRLDAEFGLEGPSHGIRASVSGPRDSLLVLAERLSLALLPAFYADLTPVQVSGIERRFSRVLVARSYLDGERAFRHGAFEAAYQAFRRATELDSTAAYVWYRRAVAAEDAHRLDDADRSAAIADARSGGLDPRDRDLVHAYAVWRTGDGWRADSLYRYILARRPVDPDAWFHFAEIAYHGGPVIGRPLDDARDAWRRTVALDSGNFPALMHAVRLEARAGNAGALRALLARASALGAREPVATESRVIAAAVTGAGDREREALLDQLPDASLHFVHAIVAGFVERPDLATAAARRLVATDRPDATRADGYIALAHLAAAGGEMRRANVMLDSAARLGAASAALHRAQFATLPFLPHASADTLAREVALLDAASSQPASAPLYLELSVDSRAPAVLHAYQRALLLHTSEPLPCGSSGDVVHELCLDLQRGVAADAALRAGRREEALRLAEQLSLRVPYQLAGRSTWFARTRERYLRAELLEDAGRLREAEEWFRAVPHAARLDYIYLAPTHLAIARLRERQGDRPGAAEHYRRVLALWATPDPALVPLRVEAERGLRRTGS